MASAPKRKRTNGVLSEIVEVNKDTSATVENTTEAVVVTKLVNTVLPVQLERRPPIPYKCINPWLQPCRPPTEPPISISKPQEYLRPVRSFLPPPSIMCPEGFEPPTRTRNDHRRGVAYARERLKLDGYQQCLQDIHTRHGYTLWRSYHNSLFDVEDLRDAEALERGFEFPEDDHPVERNGEPDWSLEGGPRESRFDRCRGHQIMPPGIYAAFHP